MLILFFFFKQKTAYEMRISDWSSDVCSSDLLHDEAHVLAGHGGEALHAQDVEFGDGERDARRQRLRRRHRVEFHDEGGEVVVVVIVLAVVMRWAAVEIGRESRRERVCRYV